MLPPPSQPSLTHASMKSHGVYHRVDDAGQVYLTFLGLSFLNCKMEYYVSSAQNENKIHKDHHRHHSIFQQILVSTYCVPDPLLEKTIKNPCPCVVYSLVVKHPSNVQNVQSVRCWQMLQRQVLREGEGNVKWFDQGRPY